MLPLERLHLKLQVQFRVWVPIQNLLDDRGKPRKNFSELAGRRTLWIQTYLSSSPPLNARTQILVSICSVTLFAKKFMYSC
jgi:hypothetical protein